MSTDWYEGILLEDDQPQLLSLLVQADNAIVNEKRDSFVLVQTQNGDFLIREGMTRDSLSLADLMTLVGAGLFRKRRASRGSQLYDVNPEGRRYWTEMMQRRRGAPLQVVEFETHNLLDSPGFNGTVSPGARPLGRSGR